MESGLVLKQFDMAERLGMTLEEIGERMSVRELNMWIVRDRNHFSEAWHQAAMIARTIANCHAAEGKSFEHEEFLPYVVNDEGSSNAATPERMNAIFTMLATH